VLRGENAIFGVLENRGKVLEDGVSVRRLSRDDKTSPSVPRAENAKEKGT
jgi:hypothetical protein